MSSDTIPTFISSHSNPYHIGYDEIIINDFNNHINQEGNLRIFFSAKFGTGKSYFLEEFFREKNKEYEVIKLYPINYSTASNNDIFELIKFDILVHLVNSHNELIKKNVKLSTFLQFQWYLKGKLNLDISEPNLDLISCLSENEEINKTLGFNINLVKTLFSIFKVVKKDFKDFQEKQKDDDEEKVLKFLDNINSKFHEYGNLDPITIVIKEIIEEINSSQTKQTVLLIDDLDRLDPEHIFRILNIFGNHFSSSSGNKFYKNENKFGFDKVILVGDTKNIKGIFHHKYGFEADFEGYFSKYYSKIIYHFSITDILTSNFDKLIIDYDLPIYNDDFQEIKIVSEWIKILLKYFISQNKINFREADKKRKYIHKVGNLTTTTYGIVQNSIPYRLAVYFVDFFEGKETFLKILNNSNDFELSFSNSENHFYINLLEETAFYLNFDIRSSDDKDKYKHEFPKKSFIEVDSFSGDNTYYIYFLPLAYSNYPNIKIEEIYSNDVDLQNRMNQLSISDISISFKKLYLKFLSKYF